MFRCFFNTLVSLALVSTCLIAAPTMSCATILSSDYVGTSTVSDRGLTITQAPVVDCKYGILCSSDGSVLWSRDADTHAAMASVTKMMTAIVALDNADLDDVYKISYNAASVGESSVGLVAGMKVDLRTLLVCMLVHSGNDAAIAIAEGVAGSVDKFVDMMNEKASAMGLSDTHFVNPHGLDAEGHYSSAADLCVIARCGMLNKTFRKIVGKKKVKVTLGNNKVTLHSTNSLLNTWGPCEGIKTGYTSDAGYCLASAAYKDGIELYAVVLGCFDMTQRFTDSYKLLDWGFSHYRSYTLATANEVVAAVPMSGYTDKSVATGVSSDVSANVLDYDGDISVDVKFVDLPDDVEVGESVGTITWRQGEQVIADEALVAKEHVSKPFPFVSVMTAACRLVGLLFGDDFVADGQLYLTSIDVEPTDDSSGDYISNKLRSAIEADAVKNA